MALAETPTLASLLAGGADVIDAGLARQIVKRIDSRRISLQGEQVALRSRYEEVMRWVNPPWNVNTRRLDPRPELQSAASQGRSRAHIDIVGQVVTRWSALEAGNPPSVNVVPPYVPAPPKSEDPDLASKLRRLYDAERTLSQNHASQMEDQTREWMEDMHFNRTLLWACWAKNAFGVAILKDGWDPVDEQPTLELYENPSQVYKGWTRRYGKRQLSWCAVVDEMSPDEANFRFGLDIPLTSLGTVDYSSWSTTYDQGDLDMRVEQQDAQNTYVHAIEYWELVREPGQKPYVWCAVVVANRIVSIDAWPWKRLPFHVIEMEHVATWAHGKSVAETAIPINESYDDLMDRQGAVIEFEAGPRYKGINMGNSGDEVDVPGPFEMILLRDGEDIQQIDTRVDFFPTQLHANELREATYRDTGLTPIAWGLSARAQTSGRALSTEWRAVELPLASRLINMSPELVEIVKNWWDYAEEYSADHRDTGKGYRRFRVRWEPLDVRDSTEKTLEVIQKLQANIIDPELAMELTGIENVDEVMARVRSYMLDPVWNPLRYQQYLVLRQLEVNIQMQQLQLAQAQQQAGQPVTVPSGGLPAPEALGQTAADQQGQAQGPVTPSMNQPGASPGGGGMPMQTSILMQPPMQGGMGNRVMLDPGAQGAAPGAPGVAGPPPGAAAPSPGPGGPAPAPGQRA